MIDYDAHLRCNFIGVQKTARLFSNITCQSTDLSDQATYDTLVFLYGCVGSPQAFNRIFRVRGYAFFVK